VSVELLSVIDGVVNEGESSGSATSELGLKSVDDDVVEVGLVHLRELLSENLLLHVGSFGVGDLEGLV